MALVSHSTPAVPIPDSSKEGGWTTVTRKGKNKGKRPMVTGPSSSSSYMVLIEEHDGSGDEEMEEEDATDPIPAS